MKNRPNIRVFCRDSGGFTFQFQIRDKQADAETSAGQDNESCKGVHPHGQTPGISRQASGIFVFLFHFPPLGKIVETRKRPYDQTVRSRENPGCFTPVLCLPVTVKILI